ncbi:hypothetical protein O5Y58_15835 [Microbacterium paraoxydans]|uniref:hypothetical protein n=1 Tax=Microbacterium paraoxydans TaxID=199592 RepID=UPI00352F2E30
MTVPPPLGAPSGIGPAPWDGHRLPPVLSSAPVPPRPPRDRRRLGIVLAGTIGAVAVVTGLGITQVVASQAYDQAASGVEDAARSVTTHQTELRERTTDLVAATDAGHVVIDTGAPALAVPDDIWAALDSAVANGEDIGAEAEDVLSTALPAVATKPGWFWELFPATDRLTADQGILRDIDDRTASATAATSEGLDAVQTSGVAVITAAGEAAGSFEIAHPSTRNAAVIALRGAAAEAVAVTEVDDAAVAAYVALQSAATDVVSAEKAELAEKAGPLRAARLAIEAFARSLAPGVLLEFDWAPVVNGAGYNGSMGGYTTWWWDTPGRAVIELSDSVAEQWPAERSKALVAHEVGHAISVKCQDMYDSSTQDSIEKWATAWAISMGFTDDANGVWAYGYPPQNYIDAAAGCR